MANTRLKAGNSKRWLRVIRRVLFGLLVVILLLLAFALVPGIPDPSLHYTDRKGQLYEVQQTAQWHEWDSIYTELTLISSSGLRVELTTRLPITTSSPRPLVLLLGGRRTGRDAVKLITDTHGVALAAISYPFAGDPKAKGVALFTDLYDIQQAIKDTAPALMLAMDYLVTQPPIDPARIELAGVSLGAFFVSVPGALDQRFRRVWLIHGAGEPAKVLGKGTERYLSSTSLSYIAGKLLGWMTLSHHLRPEDWVGRISPRPVIIINARNDPAFPASSITALHNAVNEPYEIIWMEGKHIMPSRVEIVEAISSQVLSRVARDMNNNQNN
jgi:dienelactone hydrolase